IIRAVDRVERPLSADEIVAGAGEDDHLILEVEGDLFPEVLEVRVWPAAPPPRPAVGVEPQLEDAVLGALDIDVLVRFRVLLEWSDRLRHEALPLIVDV